MSRGAPVFHQLAYFVLDPRVAQPLSRNPLLAIEVVRDDGPVLGVVAFHDSVDPSFLRLAEILHLLPIFEASLVAVSVTNSLVPNLEILGGPLGRFRSRRILATRLAGDLCDLISCTRRAPGCWSWRVLGGAGILDSRDLCLSPRG